MCKCTLIPFTMVVVFIQSVGRSNLKMQSLPWCSDSYKTKSLAPKIISSNLLKFMTSVLRQT